MLAHLVAKRTQYILEKKLKGQELVKCLRLDDIEGADQSEFPFGVVDSLKDLTVLISILFLHFFLINFIQNPTFPGQGKCAMAFTRQKPSTLVLGSRQALFCLLISRQYHQCHPCSP